jgi:hypothetical protein
LFACAAGIGISTWFGESCAGTRGAVVSGERLYGTAASEEDEAGSVKKNEAGK